MEVQNLKIHSQSGPSFSLASATHLDKLMGNSLQLTVRLADINGNSLAGGKVIAMPPLAVNAKTLKWEDNNNAQFHTKDGLVHCYFVKVKLAVSSTAIGSAFIPLHYFQLKEQTLSFPIVGNGKCSDFGSIGCLTIAIKRVEKVEAQTTASLQLRTVLRESSIFNSSWFAECLLQGAISTTDPSGEVERFAVYPAMDGLLLFGISEHRHEDTIQTSKRHSSDWRLAAYKSGNKAPLALCKERLAPDLPVVVPWEQVESVSKITSSLLWMQIKVNRCFVEGDKLSIKFKPVEIAVFVSNCPAADLQSQIVERKWFHTIRADMQLVVESKSILVPVYPPNRLSETDAVPNTETVALGSQVISDLDYASLDIELTIKALQDQYKRRNEESVHAEITILVRRNLRIRLYIAALLGMSLKGDHSFFESEIQKLLREDFQNCRKIELESEVSTANNRIEYLLDMAEHRLRDTALCGWKYKGGVLERCLDIFVNEYFIEILNHLAELFENKKLQTIQGLKSRAGLIRMYMAHNDRLKIVLTRSLRAYFLRPTPDPTLTLFLSFDTLLHWYSSAQFADMKTFVCNAFSAYKSSSKEHHSVQNPSIPWIPQCISNLPAHTTICSDLVSVLTIYLIEEKKLPVDTIAESFHSRVEEYESTLSVLYISSFSYLANLYSDSLDETNVVKFLTTSELDDYMAFLYSVANDAVYGQSSSVFPSEVINPSQYSEEIKGMRANFARLQSSALELLLNAFLKYLFIDRQQYLKADMHLHWLEDVKNSTRSHIILLLENSTEFLEGNQSALEQENFGTFCALVMEKWVQYIFWLTYALWNPNSKFSFDSNKPALVQLHQDIKSVNKLASRVYQEGLCSVLNNMYTILSEPDESPAMLESLERLTEIVRAEPFRAEAIANMIEACRDLRRPSDFRSNLAVASEVDNGPTRKKSILDNLGLGKRELEKRRSVGAETGTPHEDLSMHRALIIIREEGKAVRDSSSPQIEYPEMAVFRSLTVFGETPSIQELFQSVHSLHSVKTRRHSIDKKDLHASGSNHSAKSKPLSVVAPPLSSSSSSSSSSHKVKVSKLQVENLFRIHRLIRKSSFLQFECCGRVQRTSVQKGSRPSWTDDAPIGNSII